MAHDRVDLSDEKGWLPRVWVNGRSTNMASWMASVEDRLSYLASRITAKATSDVPTETSQTAAQASDFTTRTDTPLPLATAGQESGPAEPSCGFAHSWRLKSTLMDENAAGVWTPVQVLLLCEICGVSWQSERIPVQVAATGLSISVKQPSSPYAGAYRSGSAPLPSKNFAEHIEVAMQAREAGRYMRRTKHD